jgi:hypothetical protein
MLLPSQMKRFRTSWVRWYLSTTDVRGSLPIDWAGHRVQQASVVYVVGEGNRGIQKRGYAWKKHYHHAAPACKFLQRPVRILETQDRDEFIKTLRPHMPRFVVLDTLSTMSVGVDENDTEAMGRFMDACREISNELGATLMLVHHPTKGDANTYRGSYQLEGCVDTMIRVRKTDSFNGPMGMTLECTKQKDEERFAKLSVDTKLLTLKEATADEDAVRSLVVVEADGVDSEETFSAASRRTSASR